MENQKGFASIWLVALIVVVSAGLGYFAFKKSGTPTSPLTPVVSSKNEQVKGEVSFGELAKQCESINDPEVIPYCIQSACNIVGTTEERIKKCTKKDITIQENQDNQVNQDNCLASITPKTIAVCNAMHYGDDCYGDIAKELGDNAICDKITEFPKKIYCYKETAKIKKDPKICEKLSDDYFKNLCSGKIDQSSRLNFECSYWVSSRLESLNLKNGRINCLANAAGDFSQCDIISSPSERADCYSSVTVSVAKNKNDPAICEKTMDGSGHYYVNEFCYSEMAHLKNEPNLCNKITNEEEKLKCQKEIEFKNAIKEGNSSFCEDEIADKVLSGSEQFKPICYAEIAASTRNISICNKLETDEKKSCYYFSTEMLSFFNEKPIKKFSQEDSSLYDKYCKVSSK